jgi:formylglycine-generating enzyme required for sulfatase activity
MGNNPSLFKGCGDACPVESVRWWDAIAYANARSKAEGLPECYAPAGCQGTPGLDLACTGVSGAGRACKGYRLPTEAEWEYAARAGTTTSTYNGDVDAAHLACETGNPVLDPIAWFCGNSDVGYPGAYGCKANGGEGPDTCGTRPVAGQSPNDWGLFDMLGNAWEWVEDCWHADYTAAPASAEAWTTACDPDGTRVGRGGAFPYHASVARAAFRSHALPEGHFISLGFRVARSAD